jgi:AraC-like DNA-binding protein
MGHIEDPNARSAPIALQLLTTQNLTCPSGAPEARYTAPFTQLAYNAWYCLDGACMLDTNRQRCMVGPGEIGLAEPGVVATLTPGTQVLRCIFALLEFTKKESVPLHAPPKFGYTCGDRLPAWKDIFFAELQPKLSQRLLPDAQRLLFEIDNTFFRSRQDHRFLSIRLLHILMQHAAASLPARGEPGDAFPGQVEKLLREHIREAVTLGRVAGMLNVDLRTLIRRYRSARGVHPKAFLENLRLSHAKAGLLGNDPKGLPRVAQVSGFSGTASFRRWFRKVTGFSPLEWKQAYLNQDPRAWP